MKWFRLYDEITDDLKMIQLSDSEFRVWIYLLCYLNKQVIRGYCSDIKPVMLQLKRVLNCRTKSLISAFQKFESLGMIKQNHPSLQIVNWEKRQYQSDNVYDRVKRFRNVSRNVSETDTDNRVQNTLIVPLEKGDERFDLFWKNYPKKVGKEAARRAWKKVKIKDDAFRKIKDVLPKQIESSQWKKDGGQYIPNPATYINQGRWEDEV